MNQKYGYVTIETYKPFYFPGEIVRGFILLDIFNDLPSHFKQVNVSFTGREMVGKHYKEVKQSLEQQSKAQHLLNTSLQKKGTTLGVDKEETKDENYVLRKDSKITTVIDKSDAKGQSELGTSGAPKQKTIEDIARE